MPTPAFARHLGTAWYWGVFFCGNVAMIIGCGVLVSIFGHLLIGLTTTDLDVGTLIQLGARRGAFYAMLWAGGLSLVLCVMHAYRRAAARKATLTNSSLTNV